MTRPGAGNIHSFNSKLSQGSLKGLVKIPCEHKCRTEHGLGSRSGHERSPESKNIFFSGVRHMIYTHFGEYNSKVDAILQSDSMKVKGREGLGQPRVT